MLTENNDLNELFHEKLRNYCVNPPEYLWNRIETRLDQKTGGIKIFKILSIAASVLLLFFSGLWLNKSLFKDKEISSNFMAPNESLIDLKNDVSNKITKAEKQTVYSMASFGASTSFAEKHSGTLSTGNEPIDLDIEKKFSTPLQFNQSVFKKISDLFINNQSSRENHNFENPWSNKNERISVNSIKKIEISTTESYQTKEKNFSKWSIGLEAGPVFTKEIENLTGQFTSTENVLASGISVKYRINKKISIKSGLFSNRIIQKTELIDPSISVFNSSLGSLIWNSTTVLEIETNQIKQDLSYIEIPLLVNYKLIDRKISVGISSGISTNMLAKNKLTSLEYSGNKQSGGTANIRDIAYAGVLGVEFGYNIGKRISIIIEPQLKHYLHSLSSDPKTLVQPNQLGIYTGLSYSFE